MACAFCSIIDGATPAHRVWDDELVVAFLDIRPLFAGHTLVVPKAHHETILDLPRDDVGPFFQRVQAIDAAVVEGMGAQGSFVAMNNVVSQSVPHLHCHVVPRTKGDGLRGFFWPRTRYEDDAEMEATAAAIRAAIA